MTSSEAAISQRVKTLSIATSKVIALERAGEVVDQKLSATQRMRHVQRVILDQLEQAEAEAREPAADLVRADRGERHTSILAPRRTPPDEDVDPSTERARPSS